MLYLSNAFAQENCSCVFESDENFQLNYTIQSTDGIDKYILTLNTLNNSCPYSHSHPVRYNDSIGQFEVFQAQEKSYYSKMTDDASTYAKVIALMDLKRVEKLNFLNIKYDTDSLGFIPMSELPWIDKLETPFLKSIFIGDFHWSNSATILDIDLENWGNYAYLVRMNFGIISRFFTR
ncbi:MAG: hypothetical protein ACI865_001774 [Flavobacteriaceae bacterium]|jgi:hypothetical protein